LKEKKALLQSATANVKKAQKQNVVAEKAIAKVEKEVENIREEVKASEEEHYGPFREATGLADLHAYEQSHGPRRDEFVEKKRALIEHITQLEQHQEYESGRDLQKPIERTEKRLAERSHSLQKLQKQAEALKKKIEEQKAELEETETALKEAKAAEKQCVEKVKEAQIAYKAAQSECAAVEKQISTGEATLERLRGKLHETLQKARVEKVDLPMVGQGSALRARRGRKGRHSQGENEDDDENMMQSDTENEAVSQESTRSRTITQFSQQDNPVVVHDQNQAAQVDFSRMSEALKRRVSDREEKRVRSEFEEKIMKVSSDIENITPNLKVKNDIVEPRSIV
jgi:structural maintenance of chromosome 1